ncbi:hypothetical protein CKO39_02240 [Rhodopseudomonas palustris]|uniref:Porin n=2 Tax=Rhodopseudomonas palustris (strain ATCC BAA-98 / CGA009) TaxID=258594 RepID=Q6N662_RHOPA|nr:hypothetical protein B1S06_21615 [Rhodopseudomonas palustris]PPQ45532.1 hypothetical protein CKO39_02240 [Rhodopseudomonas palustris]CAE28198.1 hypothetical protein RPA2756 [Rhodopseudomonas palustris CGA009]
MIARISRGRGRCGRICRFDGPLAAATAMLMTAALVAPAAAAEELPGWLSYQAEPSASATVRALEQGPATKADHDDVDTEHIFGFSMGSDIGKKGEIELEIENVGRFGRRFGSYTGVGVLSQFKFTLTDNFRVAPGISFASTQISGVPGMIDNRRNAIAGASMEFRYKVLDRDEMPFGLTLHAAPGWNRVDELTGFDAQIYGTEFAALMDKELIHGKLFAAFNLWYSGGASRDLANAWSHDSEFAVQGALSYKLNPTLILGVEARYVRAYEGLGLDRFSGDAVYVGPTFSAHLTEKIGLSGTWSTQVAGQACNDPRHLDLDDFERHQAMLRFNYLF